MFNQHLQALPSAKRRVNKENNRTELLCSKQKKGNSTKQSRERAVNNLIFVLVILYNLIANVKI